MITEEDDNEFFKLTNVNMTESVPLT